jgi:NDP-sugar pyrophosphorylase family protein
MGVYVLNRALLKHLPAGQAADMPNLISNVAAAGGLVSCYRESCFWLDIGRLEDYALAQEQFTKNESLFLAD